jgi:hypothetical protein
MRDGNTTSRTTSRTAIRKREEPLFDLVAALCEGIDRQPDAVLVALIRHVDRASRHAQGRSNALKADFLHALESALESYRLGIDYSGYETDDVIPTEEITARRVRWPGETDHGQDLDSRAG